jgi:aryl-phospho-beta-D-glucosidase BglC (GH1 family)
MYQHIRYIFPVGILLLVGVLLAGDIDSRYATIASEASDDCPAITSVDTSDTSNGDGSRMERLQRGVNLSSWFRFPPEETEAHFRDYITGTDLCLIRGMGFHAVRLPIQPSYILQPDNPGVPDPVMLGYIDAAIRRILAYDLAVVVEIHPSDQRIAETATFASDLIIFWDAFARHLSQYDPDMVFLEAMNEPVFLDDPARWENMQRLLLTAMRQGAPEHTLVATGPYWSSIDGLTEITPVEDDNVIYTFHFYEPAAFTHQGATWSDPVYEPLRMLPYPSSPEACSGSLAEISDEEARLFAETYCQERWDAAKIDERIATAAAWAEQHEVVLFAGEFGVFSYFAPPEDRLRWLQDAHQSMERHDIGWFLWGYDDPFGLYRQIDEDGSRTFDIGVAEALGLHMPLDWPEESGQKRIFLPLTYGARLPFAAASVRRLSIVNRYR